MYHQYKNRLTDDMTNKQLFQVLAEMLEELRDGHVNLVTYHETSQYRKTKIEIVLEDESVLDDTIQVIIRSAYTGHHGDGRIFVLPVERSYIISDYNGEEGPNDG